MTVAGTVLNPRPEDAENKLGVPAFRFRRPGGAAPRSGARFGVALHGVARIPSSTW